MYGEVAVIRRRSAELREQAVEVRARAQALVSHAEGVPWNGRAAETMRARVRERAARMRSAAGLHEDAAEALDRHLAEVVRLQDAIGAAELRARESDADPTTSTDTATAETPPPGHRDWLTWEPR